MQNDCPKDLYFLRLLGLFSVQHRFLHQKHKLIPGKDSHLIPTNPSHLQSAQSSNFPWCMIVGNLHLQCSTRVSEVFRNQHGSLLANEQSSRVCVAANVVGADGQIGNLEALDAVDVEALVENTVLDNRVALPRRHRASSERVPCRLDVLHLVSLGIYNIRQRLTLLVQSSMCLMSSLV